MQIIRLKKTIPCAKIKVRNVTVRIFQGIYPQQKAAQQPFRQFFEVIIMNRIFDNYLFEAFANASDNIYIYVTDIETGVTRWSERAVQYFNLESEYLENVKELWLNYIHPEDHQVYLNDISKVFTGASAIHNCQYRVRNRYGEYVWVECRGSIIYDNCGNPKVFAGIMTRLDNPNKYDALTHLLSGHEFFREQIMRDGTLMMIGINGLRSINSQHGVLYGNKVICHLAETLTLHAPSARIFRYWGDDFIVYDNDATPQQLMQVFRAVARDCKEPANNREITGFTVSAGITPFKCREDHAALTGRAELTMSYAKEQSSHVAVYSPEIEKVQSRKLALSEALTLSIQDHCRGFHPVFQPIMTNDSQHIVACEALLRWEPSDASLGPCYPNEFIPILEANGGIIEAGYFIMREAIRYASVWQEKCPGLKVCVNVSYFQLEDPGFADAVIREIERCHLDPGCVVIELTESVLINETAPVKTAFDLFKQHGVHIALDDFGRGNSSFWMLHNFHVDYIKLDQSFIRTLSHGSEGIDDAIIRSTLLLCNAVGCLSIAEGVEDETVYDHIRSFGFDALQGYLFSRPLPPEELSGFIERYTAFGDPHL